MLLVPLVQDLLADSPTEQPIKETVYRLLEKHRPNRFALSNQTIILKNLIPATLNRTLFALWREPDPDVKRQQIKMLREAYLTYQLQHLDSRKKMTLQLRGFLMVFEQLMADYLLQLANTRQLFSFDPAVHHTYFTQPLKDIADLESLFLNYQEYQNTPPELTETQESFEKRRNIFLDHLLARFGEDMSRYDFYLRASLGSQAGHQLIEDKINFLADLIQVSNYRGKGSDYTNADEVWDTDNVAGLKKRISRLLGLRHYQQNPKETSPAASYPARSIS